jgi:formylglycine-generating enzyme required for sulfatase activity
LKVRSLTKPGRYGDGGNLWLQISANGGKAWLFRYRHGGRARAMGLRPVDLVSMSEAREHAVVASTSTHACTPACTRTHAGWRFASNGAFMTRSTTDGAEARGVGGRVVKRVRSSRSASRRSKGVLSPEQPFETKRRLC